MSMSIRANRNQLKSQRAIRKEAKLPSPKSNRKPKNGFGSNNIKKLGDAAYVAKLNKLKGLNKAGKPLARIAKRPRN